MKTIWIIIIGLVLLFACMLTSLTSIINNRDVLLSGSKVPVNKVEKEFMDNFTNQILSGKELVMDDYGNVSFENTTVEQENDNIIRNDLSATIDDENNIIRINRGSYYTIYNHDGTNITGVKSYIDYATNEEAKTELAEINKENLDANVKDVYVEDNRIVIDYEEEMYKTLTLKEIQLTAQFYEKYQGLLNQ